MKKYLLLVSIFFLMPSCAPWVRTGGPFTASAQNVIVDLPDGWMRLNTNEFLFITRDGKDLQYIVIQNIHTQDTLKYTKKKLRKGMLPLEAAEVIIDNISSNQDVLNLEVKENKSVKIGGHPGFRALLTYKNRNGLRIRSVYCGFMEGEWFYGIRYAAPQRHYFDKDIRTFEKVVSSLKLARST